MLDFLGTQLLEVGVTCMRTLVASSVMAMTVEERFFDKVQIDKETGCLNWTAGTNSAGYGVFSIEVEGKGRRPVVAHRVSWFLEYGVWPEHTLDHLCHNRLCVNPRHLEDVSQGVNAKRAIAHGGHPNANKTHCKRGHELTEANVRYGRRGNGKQFLSLIHI